MKICLCGSTRFMDQFHEANVSLTLAGHVVYSVATSTKRDFQPTEEQKLVLDMVHLRKIEESEAIMVVGYREDGSTYLGESTTREIAFARAMEKEVFIYRPNREVNGPATQFHQDLQTMGETDAQREESRRARELQMREVLQGSLQSTEETDDDDDSNDDESLEESSERLS